MLRYICVIWLCMPSSVFADSDKVDEKDLYVREAFFHAQQGEYIDAISRLDIALGPVGGLVDPRSQSLSFNIGEKQFSAGDFEVSYRMFNRVERGYDEALNKNIFKQTRNDALYHLARIYMRESHPEKALTYISRTIESDSELSEDSLFLRSQIYLSNGKFPEAVNLLRKLEEFEEYRYFAMYNLAIALLRSGQESAGLKKLEKLGMASSGNEVDLALIDKANLQMGSLMLEKKQPILAKKYFNRVRLSGPFTNKALLGSGWADVAQDHFDRALVPWTELTKRDVGDRYVREGLLGVAYSYENLKLPGRANLQYKKAIEAFDHEISRLDASIKRVEDGKFLLKVFRIGLKNGSDWPSKLRNEKKTPETQYLWELLVSNDIQRSLDNYMDLDALARKIKVWERYLDEKYTETGQPVSDGLAKARNKAKEQAGEKVKRIRASLRKSKQQVYALLPKQRKLFETMVIDELKQRRDRATEYRVQAGLGVIESYKQAEKLEVQPRGGK